jgi:hypothetical protein
VAAHPVEVHCACRALVTVDTTVAVDVQAVAAAVRDYDNHVNSSRNVVFSANPSSAR